jgi:hypothetical protein
MEGKSEDYDPLLCDILSTESYLYRSFYYRGITDIFFDNGVVQRIQGK